MIPLITIEGPTASGKSALALILAEELGAQIVSADSRQIYRYMDIGTAKPGQGELKRVPHYLIDIIDPDQSYNAGLFCRDAESVIGSLYQNGIPVIVCGGTGLYVRSLLEGLFDLPDVSQSVRAVLRDRLSESGLEALYQELQIVDKVFAASISANDKQRVLRGLEVYYASGKSISDHWREQQRVPRYRVFRMLVLPPREVLYGLINTRMSKMLDAGLIDEITSLLNSGFTAASPGLNSLGYKEFLPYIEGTETLTQCLELATQHSRNYAKRQTTWYRKYKFDLTITDYSISISGIIGAIRSFFL